jgi:peptidyl-prolyl cis-trans isomerase C
VTAIIHSLKPDPSPRGARPANTESRNSKLRAGIGFISREPFFQFLILGLLIWAAVENWNANRDRYIINVGPQARQRIAENYSRQFGQPPTLLQLNGLIDRYVREEIYWREGLALNLDHDDEIIRRRIVEKYEFLNTDLAVPETPTDAVLQRWFEQNKERYTSSERVAFSHVYFSPDRDGEQAAKARAMKTLQELLGLHRRRPRERGDAFPGPSDAGALSRTDAAQLFGESELSEKLFDLPAGQWSGPYRSGYGWHLVYLTRRLPAVQLALADIRQRVLADYQDEQQREFNARAFEKLRVRYTIRYDGGRR